MTTIGPFCFWSSYFGALRSDEPKHCKVFDGVGKRVVSMASVEDGETLYVVPQHRTFVWPTVEIGRRVTVPHVKTPLGELVTLASSDRGDAAVPLD